MIVNPEKQELKYPKYITIELMPPAHLSLRFHRFFNGAIVKKCRLIPGMQFNMEIRAWINSKDMYRHTLEFLKPICT